MGGPNAGRSEGSTGSRTEREAAGGLSSRLRGVQVGRPRASRNGAPEEATICASPRPRRAAARGPRRPSSVVPFGSPSEPSSVGCAVSMRAPKIDSRAETKVAVNANQVRLKMRSLVGPMCGEIERAADEIAAGTADPAVRRAAIRWKIEAVPTLRAALFQPEPFTAVLDTWVFFNQMADFFETGAGRKQLGDSAPVAVESCRRLEQEMADVFAAMTASGDVSKVRAFAKSWAADHPIRYAIPDREVALGRALEREVPESWSTGEAVAEITTSIDDLNRKLDVYSDQLFRQVRWEAELLGGDLELADVPPLAERAVQSAERAAADLDRLAPGFERAVAVAEGAPALVASERKAAIDGLSRELTRTITFLQQERIAALRQVTAERIAAISGVSQAVSEERKAFDRDIERIGLQLVDRAMWRLAQLVAAVLVFSASGPWSSCPDPEALLLQSFGVSITSPGPGS